MGGAILRAGGRVIVPVGKGDLMGSRSCIIIRNLCDFWYHAGETI